MNISEFPSYVESLSILFLRQTEQVQQVTLDAGQVGYKISEERLPCLSV